MDKATFAEIKAAQEDEISSIDVSLEMNISLAEVNHAFKCKDYKEFMGQKTPEKLPEEPKKSKIRELISINHKQEKQDEGTVNDKKSQIDILKKHINSQWDMVNLLEMRKSQLVRDIKMMEEYIRKGIEVTERHLE